MPSPGKMMKKAIVYLHGKGGTVEEAKHYKALFPSFDLLGFDYRSATPWEAKEEFPAFFESLFRQYEEVSVIANSLGAYLLMESMGKGSLKKAYFISPIVDMNGLITEMMAHDGISRDRLAEEKEIPSSFGEVLSWKYLRYTESSRLNWPVPTTILYGSLDYFTSRETMTAFAERIHASLFVMEGGEHYFHTEEQMAFLDKWILKEEKAKD